MWIEIMARFEMRAQQQDKACVGVIWRRAIIPLPQGVPGASAGGADIGMAVMAVDSPRMEYALIVEQFVSRTTDVIENFVAPTLC
jgi:hypothetical protein